MFRKYFRLGKCIQTFIYTNQSIIPNTNANQVNYLPKRCAGHSKWQNIKNTKQNADRLKASTFSKLARLIAIAAKENADPVLNSKLRSLVEEAQKANMPKASIQRAINAAKTALTRPYWTVFSGPKGVLVGLEVTFANTHPNYLRHQLILTRKLNLKMEPHIGNVCTEKGIIITDFLEKCDKPFEKALEDAIEVGVNEVYEDDDSLIFECLPDRVDSISEQLSKRGYNVLSASTELEFNNTVSLGENEIQEIENLISKLQSQHEEVVRGCYNLTG